MRSLTADRIRLQSPAALCCAVPYLLGFHPQRSAVLLWLQGSQVILTERIDLPPPEIDASVWARAAGSHPVAGTTDTVIVVLFPDEDLPADDAHLRTLARALVDQQWAPHVDVVRMLGDRWRDLLCDDPGCCSPEGEPIDQGLREAIAAEFAGRGVSPLGSRDALVGALAPDVDLVEQVVATGVLAGERGVGLTGARREAWRDDMIQAHLAWARDRSAEPDPKRMATLLLALRDIRVRDTVLWEVARMKPRRVVVAADQFTRLLRAAPEGDVAAVAVCACVAAWLVGDGTRASVAVDRALADAPDYLMAVAFDQALRAGQPPYVWRDAVRTLSREDCRHPSPFEDPDDDTRDGRAPDDTVMR